jgi:hypothetical protein
VDPVSHKLTGVVVDWESASIVPAWEMGGGVPYFLQGRAPYSLVVRAKARGT